MLKGKPSEIAVASAGFSTIVTSRPLTARGVGKLGRRRALRGEARESVLYLSGALGIEASRKADA